MYRVMLVDDEYMILEGLKWIISWETLGFEIVKTARSAKEALAYLANQKIDLLVTDITMPEMSGISLIAEAKAQGADFFSLILSGYQEFDYVKQGMALNVKNYLVKPVNQEELLQSVKSIKQELDAQKQREIDGQNYLETGLMRLLNDELNESEYMQLMTCCDIAETEPFTAVLVEGPTQVLAEVSSYLQKEQPLQIKSKLTSQKLVLIYRGTRQHLLIDFHQVDQILAGRGQVYFGETVADWENLYESYEKVKQRQILATFYQGVLPDNPLTKEDPANALTFLSFNKSLMIGDRQTIFKEAAQIFDQLVQQQASPNEVRYVVFLLFADIYRQYPELSKEEYAQFVDQIRQSQQLAELSDLVYQLLASLKGNSQSAYYTKNVRQAVALIESRYFEELNLKLVADQLHLSVVYLGQVFKKETQRSFAQYLNQIRIKHAQKLLLYTERSIAEIAEEVGFNNTNYFTKMFKKLNGLTAKEFREKYNQAYAPIEE